MTVLNYSFDVLDFLVSLSCKSKSVVVLHNPPLTWVQIKLIVVSNADKKQSNT